MKTFYESFVYNDAIDKAIKDIVSDMEYQNSDEAIDEMLIANEYEFDEDGRFYQERVMNFWNLLLVVCLGYVAYIVLYAVLIFN